MDDFAVAGETLVSKVILSDDVAAFRLVETAGSAMPKIGVLGRL